MARPAHRGDRRDRLVDPLERDAPVTLDQHAERAFGARLHRLRRGEDVFVDAVAHVEDARARLQLLERLGDPARLGDEVHRQRVCERGADARRVPAAVEAVLEALDEVGVAVGVQVEQVGRGLPPGRHRHVVAVLPRTLDREDVQSLEPAEAPVRLLLPARHGKRDVEAVAGGELARVLDDDAHAAGELEVLQEECDLQGAGYRTGALHSAADTERVPAGAQGAVARMRPLRAAPARIAFVGQDTYFEATALTSPTPEVLPRFIDFRAGAEPQPMLEAVEAFAPDVVIVFRPEIIPGGLFASLRVPTLGFLTEPLPRGDGQAPPGPRGAPRRDQVDRPLELRPHRLV